MSMLAAKTITNKTKNHILVKKFPISAHIKVVKVTGSKLHPSDWIQLRDTLKNTSPDRLKIITLPHWSVKHIPDVSRTYIDRSSPRN